MTQIVRTRPGTPVLIAPVKRTEDILPILRAGAKEVYGGVIDPAWDEALGQYIEMNRRSSFGSNANLIGCAELCKAVKLCKDHGAEFHFTLNALQIPEKYHTFLKPILNEFAKAGGKKVILSDSSLIPLILAFDLQPVISSCADVTNTVGVKFYQQRNCQRIIFPRYMLLEDIETIVNVVPNMEYEAFLMNGACRFHDGCCFCMHGTSYKGLCDTLDYAPYHLKEDLSQSKAEIAAQMHHQFKESYYRACGLCALFRLSRSVDSLKIVGRNADLNSTVSDIQLANQNLEIALQCHCEEEYLSSMIKPKDKVIRCSNHLNCYYIM